MERQYSPNRLTLGRRFIVGSALVHLFALAWLPGLQSLASAPPALSVQLRAAAPLAATEPQVDKTTRRPPEAKRRPPEPPSLITRAAPSETATEKPVPSVAAIPVAAPTPVAAEAPPPVTTLAAPAPAPVAEVRERRGKPSTLWLAGYTKTISGQVGRLKHYPQIARLRGWQGTAVISIQLAADGTVLQIRVEQSSGHEILDSQALAMVRQAEPLPPYPERHDGDPLTVRLPIVFALATP